jgi:hypothetical protein
VIVHATRPTMRAGRREALRWLVGATLCSVCAPRWARADDPEVPIGTQVGLLSKVVKYDHNAAGRMGGTCRALIVRRQGDGGSARVAASLEEALAGLGEIAGAKLVVSRHDYGKPDALARACKEASISLVLVTPGLSDEAAAIGRALVDTDLLTMSVVASDVAAGIVLGFALEAARPTILVNLAQAKRQNVDFSARLLALAKVVGGS